MLESNPYIEYFVIIMNAKQKGIKLLNLRRNNKNKIKPCESFKFYMDKCAGAMLTFIGININKIDYKPHLGTLFWFIIMLSFVLSSIYTAIFFDFETTLKCLSTLPLAIQVCHISIIIRYVYVIDF